MNNDEQFENRLRRQPLRTLPPAWRGEILAAAARQRTDPEPRGHEGVAALVAGWRRLFARMPVAWAALAALWLGLIGVNLTMPGPMVSVSFAAPTSARWSALAALDSSVAEFDANGDSRAPASKAAPTTRPSEAPLRPRSELQRGVEFGATPPAFAFSPNT